MDKYCNTCKNYASVLCKDCIRRIDINDFYENAGYTTETSKIVEESDDNEDSR